MKISIITVAYNSESSIEDTIKSVISQTYRDIEYIIVDGQSIDNTLSIINKYSDKVSKIISEPDQGIYDAMNKGLKISSGDIVGFLNSDDTYSNCKALSTIADCFKKNKVDAVHANINFIDSKDRIVRVWNGANYEQGAFLSGWSPAHPTFYLKRIFYQKYGVFDKSFTRSADFELMLRMIEIQKLQTFFIPEILVNFRIGGVSTKSVSGIIKGNIEDLRAFEKHGIYINPFLYIPKRLIPKIISMIKCKIISIYKQ